MHIIIYYFKRSRDEKAIITIFISNNCFFCITDIYAAVRKPWTVLMYIAAANDLNPFALYDLDEMMRIGSNENLNVIVYLTLQQDGKPKTTRKLYITAGQLNQIGDTIVRDSGDVNTLKEALHWACVDYPSDRMAVVLWDHGSGPLNRDGSHILPRGVCYDYDTGNYLTDRDCLDAFAWAKNNFRGGKKFDIIAFDACLMATLEMAYTLASCADYMVASEETIPGDGFQYAYMLSPLRTLAMSGLDFARHMVAAYKQEYTGTPDFTLSATDLNAIQALIKNTNAIAQTLTTQLKGIYKTTVKSTLRRCISSYNCVAFDNGTYIDLLNFYKNLLVNISGLRLSSTGTVQFKQLLNESIALLGSVIKANVTSANYTRAGGLAMYMARYTIDASYHRLYWTQYYPQWLNFLQAFLS